MREQANWSVSLGRWGGINVRLHVLFLLFVACTLYFSSTATPFPTELAFHALGILFASVLLHEIGHLLAARRAGGGAKQLVIGPLGGMVPVVAPANNPRAEIVVHLAGPLVNLLVCAVVALTLRSQIAFDVRGLMNPLQPGKLVVAGSEWETFLRLTFWINWSLLTVNLFPAFPFDGGRALRAAIMLNWPRCSRHMAAMVVAWIAKAGAFALLLVAVSQWQKESQAQVPIWFALSLLAIFLYFSAKQEESRAESIPLRRMKSEFAEEPEHESFVPATAGPFSRWRAERRAARLERKREKEAAEERRVDEILHQLHASGMDSLSSEDRLLLERVSRRYRDRQSP